jgi:hypothetical protein
MRVILSISVVALFSGLLPLARGSGLSSVSCPSATLAFYQVNFSSSTPGSPDGPCANGILNFSGFGFNSSGSPVSALLGNNDIDLSPLGPPLGQTGDTGFSISGMSVGARQTATYVIDWFFAIDAGPSASGADLGMDPPFGSVTITQDYCVDSFITAYGAGSTPTCYSGNAPPIQSLTVTTSVPNASIIFSPQALNFADVRTIIQLNGGTTGAGFDSLTGESTISVAPEPGTVMFAFAGLSMLCFLRRRAVRQ